MTIRLLASVERMMKPNRVALFVLWLTLGSGAWGAPDEWQPAKGPLMTRWAKDVSPRNAHTEYPRPQMVRKDWENLNGLWDYRSEEHTSELQSRPHLVCRLLLEKKK